MKVNDTRTGEKLLTVPDLKPGDVFEIPEWGADHYASPFVKTDGGGRAGSHFVSLRTGLEYGDGEMVGLYADMQVRRLKATLVLEDLGTAS